MPPRKKQAPQAPSTMKELKDTLWKAADKLRGSLSASQYKDVILGLVFLSTCPTRMTNGARQSVPSWRPKEWRSLR